MAQTLTLRAYGRTVGLTGSAQALELARERLPPSYRPASGRAEQSWRVVEEGRDVSESVEVALSDLELWVAEHARGAIFIHAGCAVADGRAILLPGFSFAGKTSLTAALVRAGALYYSDEYAVLDHQGLVRPYARRLCIRERNAAGTFTRRRVSVTELGGRAGHGPAQVGLIASLRYDSGAPAAVTVTVSRARGAMVLLENAVGARSRTRACIGAIGSAVRGAQVLEGSRGEADEAAQMLLELLSASEAVVRR